MPIPYDTSWVAFLVITVLLGGSAALMTGRAVASTWQPLWKAVAYVGLLAAAVRFLHYALAGGTAPATLATASAINLIGFYLVDWLVLVVITMLAYRITLASRMVTQYPWMYRRTGPFSWENTGTGK